MPGEFESGFFIGKPAWHRLGTVLDVFPSSWIEACTLAGLNWEVQIRPLFDSKNKKIPYKGIFRSSDDSCLGLIKKNTWRPLQNKNAFKFFEPFIKSGEARFHTAGALQGGKIIWVLAQLAGKAIGIGGNDDKVLKFLLLSNV